MGKTKKNNKKGGGIGKSKPEKPHTPPEKTRKNVNFSPTTKPPSSPKQNKTKQMFISRNRERQKAVTRYENQQEQLDLMDMVLGKKPLEGGKKKRKNRKKRTRRRKKGGNEEEGSSSATASSKKDGRSVESTTASKKKSGASLKKDNAKNK